MRTLEETPRGATHWSIRDMTKASGLERTTVNQIWGAFGLQPHRSDTFKLSIDPLLIEKVRDIVGVVHESARARPLFCVDEESQIQAVDRTQPLCRCSRDRANGARTITSGMARRRCLPHST